MVEYGITAAQGAAKLVELIGVVHDDEDRRLPALARDALRELVRQIEMQEESIKKLDLQLVRQAREDETARRLTSIPGIGAITAAALRGLVPDPGGFASARHFAAWLGLTPRLNSSGGKERLGRISKQATPRFRACERQQRRNGCPEIIRSQGLRHTLDNGRLGFCQRHALLKP
ncbi:MAG: IS110 family transposase [Acetobacteraceae bacterium]|nr:IS110 family transposase [Acetobacteraceae bacterium]